MTEQEHNTDQNIHSETGIHTDPVDRFNCTECGKEISVAGTPAFSEITCPSCDAKLQAPARLGNFLLLKLIGTGGMGGVYYARDEQLGRNVAIKVMLKSLGDDQEFIETFRREAQAVAKLNHSNIAQIYSFGQEKGQPYIVMELVSGDHVDELMEQPGGLAPLLAIRIGVEIAQGLSAADEAGLVHGDIKPENILLDNKGRAKLVDFGLATVAHQAAGEGIWGTPYYIAPEKIKRQKVDARSDIYSLGASLYHMLTNKPPFDGDTPVAVVKARLEAPPPNPCDADPDLPAKVGEVITRMLAVERTERYPNYRSLISDLKKAMNELDSISSTARASGKQIRIKKKGAAANSKPTESDPSASPASPGTKDKKIVIRKDQRSATPGTTKIKSTQSTIIPEPTPEELAAKALRAKKRKQRTITILIILLLVAIAGTGTSIFLYRQSEERKERAAQIERLGLQTEINQVMVAITDKHERLSQMLESSSPLTNTIAASMQTMGLSLPTSAPDAPEAPPQDQNTNTTEQADAPPQDLPPSDRNDTNENDAPQAEPPADNPLKAEVAALARDAYSATATIEAALQRVTDRLNEAQELADQAQKLNNAARIRQKRDQILELDNQSREDMLLASRSLSSLSTAHKEIADLFAQYQREEKQRLAAEREAERLREIEAQREREARQRQQQIASEKSQAIRDAENITHYLDANAFEKAYSELTKLQPNYTTEEGKAAFDIALQRTRYLAAMKEAIITGIQEEPFPWGWGFGATARDIVRANERGIYIKDYPTPAKWETVQAPQMLKLVDRYLASRAIGVREKINLAFGAAIYCDQFGEEGRQRAIQYANRALDLGLKRETFETLLQNRWNAENNESNDNS